MSGVTMQAQGEREVIELHQFFQDWFTGVLLPTEANFARVADVLSEGFVLINPDGKMIEHAHLLPGLRQAHGQRPDFRIWIEKFRWHYQAGEFGLATYEEWQQTGDKTTARLSSVLFGRKPGLRNGVQWLHVHETWLLETREGAI